MRTTVQRDNTEMLTAVHNISLKEFSSFRFWLKVQEKLRTYVDCIDWIEYLEVQIFSSENWLLLSVQVFSAIIPYSTKFLSYNSIIYYIDSDKKSRRWVNIFLLLLLLFFYYTRKRITFSHFWSWSALKFISFGK